MHIRPGKVRGVGRSESQKTCHRIWVWGEGKSSSVYTLGDFFWD